MEEKLAALEEKLALAKEAVDNEARKVADRTAAADAVLDREPLPQQQPAASDINIPKKLADDASAMKARKSRLSG